jgi:hypothetical protein
MYQFSVQMSTWSVSKEPMTSSLGTSRPVEFQTHSTATKILYWHTNFIYYMQGGVKVIFRKHGKYISAFNTYSCLLHHMSPVCTTWKTRTTFIFLIFWYFEDAFLRGLWSWREVKEHRKGMEWHSDPATWCGHSRPSTCYHSGSIQTHNKNNLISGQDSIFVFLGPVLTEG